MFIALEGFNSLECGLSLGSSQILICGESESIRVTTHKTKFCGAY